MSAKEKAANLVISMPLDERLRVSLANLYQAVDDCPNHIDSCHECQVALITARLLSDLDESRQKLARKISDNL